MFADKINSIREQMKYLIFNTIFMNMQTSLSYILLTYT